jgi:hypothetical protein
MKSGTGHPRLWFAFLLAIVLTLVVAMINVGGEPVRRRATPQDAPVDELFARK